MSKCCDKYGSRFAKSKYVWNCYDDDDENAWKLVVSFRSRIKNSHGLYNLCSQFIRKFNRKTQCNSHAFISFISPYRTYRARTHTHASAARAAMASSKQQPNRHFVFQLRRRRRRKTTAECTLFLHFLQHTTLTRVWYCVYLVVYLWFG